ncbi:MAG: DoxX family protein [Chloroflexi bacterium]|nr:DoxX family protein [Chloroflexota bacterium]
MKDIGLLILRLTSGGLVAAHGLQKLTGVWSGPGLKGTAGFMEAIGLKPGHYWGTAAAVSETSGILTALGFLHPLGPLGTLSAMTMAAGTVHRGKPVWTAAGGAELPLTNIGTAGALLFTGPGKISFDALFGIRLPRVLVALAMMCAAGAVAYGLQSAQSAQSAAAGSETLREEVQSGEASHSS